MYWICKMEWNFIFSIVCFCLLLTLYGRNFEVRRPIFILCRWPNYGRFYVPSGTEAESNFVQLCDMFMPRLCLHAFFPRGEEVYSGFYFHLFVRIGGWEEFLYYLNQLFKYQFILFFKTINSMNSVFCELFGKGTYFWCV